jgi:hypothetical protein
MWAMLCTKDLWRLQRVFAAHTSEASGGVGEGKKIRHALGQRDFVKALFLLMAGMVVIGAMPSVLSKKSVRSEAGTSFVEVRVASASPLSVADALSISPALRKGSRTRPSGYLISQCVLAGFSPFGMSTAVDIGGAWVSVVRHSYWHGFERDDDEIAQRSVIYRPDLNELIFLDLKRKRYDIVWITRSVREAGIISYVNSGGPVEYSQDRIDRGYSVVAGKRVRKMSVAAALTEIRSGKLIYEQYSDVFFLNYPQPKSPCDNLAAVPDPKNFFRPLPDAKKEIVFREKGPAVPANFRLYQTIEERYFRPRVQRGFLTIIQRDREKVSASEAAMFDIPQGFRKIQM